MIRFKDKIFEDYYIDPITAQITDKNGVVQPLTKNYGRLYFKGMKVHQIMAHTYLGYKPKYEVHHLDENKLNNALSNLVYLTKENHTRIHMTALLTNERKEKLSAAHKGKLKSAETKIKMSKALSGNKNPMYGKDFSEEHRTKLSEAKKGKSWWNNGIESKMSKECPGEGWTKGMKKQRKKFNI